jgi:hypothetical protein
VAGLAGASARFAEVDAAGQLAHHQHVGAGDGFGAEGRGVWTKAVEAGRREGRRKRGSRRGRRPRMAGCCKGVIEPLHDLLLRLPLLLLVHGRLSAASCASVVWVGDRALGVRPSTVLLLQ